MKSLFNKKSVTYTGLGILGLTGVFGLVNSGIELADANISVSAEHFVKGILLMSGAAIGARFVARQPKTDNTPKP